MSDVEEDKVQQVDEVTCDSKEREEEITSESLSLPNLEKVISEDNTTKEVTFELIDQSIRSYFFENSITSSPPLDDNKCSSNLCLDSYPIMLDTLAPYGFLYFDDIFFEGNMGCETKKIKRKKATSEKSHIYGPTLVREKDEVKVLESPKEKDKGIKSEFVLPNHYTCLPHSVLFFQDFVESLRGAQFNHSTYDKDSVPVIIDQIPFAGSDSRTNPFEERGNDTCMRRPKQYKLDKKTTLILRSRKSVT